MRCLLTNTPVAQQAFLTEVYEPLKTTLGEHDRSYFIDGVHVRHNSVPAYAWIPKGEERELPANTGRKRININGAIDIVDMNYVWQESDTINADSVIDTLRTLDAQNSLAHVIYVIADNARYYKSRMVRKYLETSKVRMIYLPPYSPNLNIIERLWKYMRSCVLHNQYYEHYAEFASAIHVFMNNVHNCAADLNSLLVDRFEIIDAK